MMVKGLVWDDWNRERLDKHKVTIEEVEEVCHGKYKVTKSFRKRIMLVGKTKNGRRLAVVLSPEDRNMNTYKEGGEEMKKPNISIFKDRDKEAKFWEKNFDTAWKLGKPVKVSFAKNLSVTLNIRLDPKTLGKVRIRAAQNGLGPTQLIRVWIMEKLRSRDKFQTAV